MTVYNIFVVLLVVFSLLMLILTIIAKVHSEDVINDICDDVKEHKDEISVAGVLKFKDLGKVEKGVENAYKIWST